MVPTSWDFSGHWDWGWCINLVEEISKQPNIQAVAWLLLDAFSQIYRELGLKDRAKKIWKTYVLAQKESCIKWGLKDGKAAKKISTIKKKTNTLYRDGNTFWGDLRYHHTPPMSDWTVQKYQSFTLEEYSWDPCLRRASWVIGFPRHSFVLSSHCSHGLRRPG